jgi:hypothetical protein
MKHSVRIRVCGVEFTRFVQRRISKEWVVSDSVFGWIPLTAAMDYGVAAGSGVWLKLSYDSVLRVLDSVSSVKPGVSPRR